MGNRYTGNTKHTKIWKTLSYCDPPSLICTYMLFDSSCQPPAKQAILSYYSVCAEVRELKSVPWRNRIVCINSVSGGMNVANSRFIRVMQSGKLFQTVESVTCLWSLICLLSNFNPPSFPPLHSVLNSKCNLKVQNVNWSSQRQKHESSCTHSLIASH